MKLDVEGAEFELLPLFIESRAICEVKYIAIELHHRIFPGKNLPDIYAYSRLIQKLGNCTTDISEFDDETYCDGDERNSPLPGTLHPH